MMERFLLSAGSAFRQALGLCHSVFLCLIFYFFYMASRDTTSGRLMTSAARICTAPFMKQN